MTHELRNGCIRCLAVALGMALMLVLGCSDDGLGKRYPVYGTVTYKGEPVAKGNINFVPTGAEGRAANGPIENGKYTLSTLGNDDGAFPGSYQVAIIATDADYTQVKANAGGGAGRQDDVYKANMSAKSLIPTKYRSIQTSDLKAEIKPESNKFDFTLTD